MKETGKHLVNKYGPGAADGSKMSERNQPCEISLDHLRTENMKNEKIY